MNVNLCLEKYRGAVQSHEKLFGALVAVDLLAATVCSALGKVELGDALVLLGLAASLTAISKSTENYTSSQNSNTTS